MEKLKPKGKPAEQIKKGYPKPSKPITLDDSNKPSKVIPDTELSLKESKAFLLKTMGNEAASLFFGTSGSWDRWLRIILIIVVLIIMTINSIF